jgi:FkbM family methyltransferase
MHASASRRYLFPASLLVGFYRLWHGALRLKGAGYLVTRLAWTLRTLQAYPLRLPEGQIILVDFRDVSGMTWLNFLIGDDVQEAGLLKAMNSAIDCHTVVWDVGANCGLVSYLLASTTAAVKVVSFEPNTRMHLLCCSALKPFSNTSCLGIALSDREGETDIFVPRGASTMGTMQPVKSDQIGQHLQISCAAGDDLLSKGVVPAPDVIKIDTEGHELVVLQGLRETIRRHRPIIFLEHISLTDADILGSLPDDYEVFSVSSSSGSLARGIDRSRGHNSVVVHRDSRLHTLLH